MFPSRSWTPGPPRPGSTCPGRGSTLGPRPSGSAVPGSSRRGSICPAPGSTPGPQPVWVGRARVQSAPVHLCRSGIHPGSSARLGRPCPGPPVPVRDQPRVLSPSGPAVPVVYQGQRQLCGPTPHSVLPRTTIPLSVLQADPPTCPEASYQAAGTAPFARIGMETRRQWPNSRCCQHVCQYQSLREDDN